VLNIDGWLQAAELPELERACRDLIGPLTLDLSGLRLADGPAIQALRNLQASGARLTGVSAYLALKLAPLSDSGSLLLPAEASSTCPGMGKHSPPTQED